MLMDTVVLPGFPGPAAPLAGATLIQFAGAAEVSVVVTDQVTACEPLLIVRVCGDGNAPGRAEKVKKNGDTGAFAATTFKVTAIPVGWQAFTAATEQLKTAVYRYTPTASFAVLEKPTATVFGFPGVTDPLGGVKVRDPVDSEADHERTLPVVGFVIVTL